MNVSMSMFEEKFTVQNDHMPLKSIFSKSLSQCPPRIRRFLLSLQRYEFDFEYIPGRALVVADILSRAALHEMVCKMQDCDIVHYVSTIVNNLPISEKKLAEMQQ